MSYNNINEKQQKLLNLTKMLKEYQTIDDHLCTANNRANVIRKQKKLLHEKILYFIKNNNLENNKFVIENDSFNIHQSSSLQPLTIDLVKNSLDKFLDSSTTSKIIEYIQRQRQSNKKNTTSLKRKSLKRKPKNDHNDTDLEDLNHDKRL